MIEVQFEGFANISFLSLSQEERKTEIKKGFDRVIKWLNDVADDKEEFETNDKWWKQADTIKKNGFYVNLLKKKQDWSGPFLTKKPFYQKSKKIVSNFLVKIEALEENFNDEDFVMAYKDFQNKSEKKG